MKNFCKSAFLACAFFSMYGSADADVIFQVSPDDFSDRVGSNIIASDNPLGYYSFMCSLNPNNGDGCHDGPKIYNVGFWLKKVGNPDDLVAQAGTAAWLSTSSFTAVSNPVSTQLISDQDFQLVYFYFPDGIVLNQGLTFSLYASSSDISIASGNYYSVDTWNNPYIGENDYTFPASWCFSHWGCASSRPFISLETNVADLSPQPDLSDNTPPTITILGDNPATVYLGDHYTDAGATVLDDTDGDLTANILTFNTVDTVATGTYSVIYTAFDAAGNIATAIRNVNVLSPKLEPVIIIPGIMGTYLFKAYGDNSEIWPNISKLLLSISDNYLDDLSLNPDGSVNASQPIETGDIIRKITVGIGGLDYTSDTFNGLINELTSNGYVEGQDLFVFPYDWRLDNAYNATLLKNKIDAILASTSQQKINIIAHSMGGLVAKSYIAQNGTSTIDKIIFIGTPHLGAPKAFKALMYGDDMGIKFPIINSSVLQPTEVKHISQNMPGVFELLPSRKYIDELGNTYIDDEFDKIGQLSFSQTENFMASSGRNADMFPSADHLHDSIDDLDLTPFNSYNFSGCGTTKTIGQIVLTKKKNGSQSYQVKYVNGDNTVPLISSDMPAKENFYVTGYEHSQLPSAKGVKQDILSILKTGNTDADYKDVSTSNTICQVSGKAVSVHSPVSLDIYDNDNNHTGLTARGTIEYGIPGVDWDEIEGEKFAFLPDGLDYKIQMNAEATGTFDFYIDDVSGTDQISNEKSWIDVPIQGTSSMFEIDISTGSLQQINVDENSDGNFEKYLKPGYMGTLSQKTGRKYRFTEPAPDGEVSASSSMDMGGSVVNKSDSIAISENISTTTNQTVLLEKTGTTTKISKKIEVNKLVAIHSSKIFKDVLTNTATAYEGIQSNFFAKIWQSIITFFHKLF